MAIPNKKINCSRCSWIEQSKGGSKGCLYNQQKKNTYNCVNKARESKMPGGSSIRLFDARSLKPARNKIEKKN